MRKAIINHKVIGYIEGNYLGYFHSDCPDSPFSNFYQANFTVYHDSKMHKLSATQINGATVQELHFNCVEQLFAWYKAIVCGDHRSATKILATTSVNPVVFKKLGRKVQGYSDELWVQPDPKAKRSAAETAMLVGMQAKFNSDPFFKQALLFAQENNLHLAEVNPHDGIWGTKTSLKKPGWSNFKGQNKQGKLLDSLIYH